MFNGLFEGGAGLWVVIMGPSGLNKAKMIKSKEEDSKEYIFFHFIFRI